MNRFIDPEIGSFTIEVEDTFLGNVKDVYKVKDKGLVLTSKILSGKLYPNDKIKVLQRSDNKNNYNMTVGQLSLFGKVLEYADKGDEPGILLAGTEQMSTSDIERGAVITSPETKRVIVTRKVVGTLHITGKTAPITPGHKLSRQVFICGFHPENVVGQVNVKMSHLKHIGQSSSPYNSLPLY